MVKTVVVQKVTPLCKKESIVIIAGTKCLFT